MSDAILCPCCGTPQAASSMPQMQSLPASVLKALDSRKFLRSITILLLALTILGLPLANWLCRRYEVQDRELEYMILGGSFVCAGCGHKWSVGGKESITLPQSQRELASRIIARPAK